MEELLIETGLIGDNKVVIDYLEANNIKTVKELKEYDIDLIEDIYIKNQLRGLKDLLDYKFSYRPLPFDTFLNTKITYKYNDNAYLTVNFGLIDFNRMGISFSEQLDLKAWAKVLYNQYETREITLIELMKSFIKYGSDNTLSRKLCVYVEYYDKDKQIVKGENTMSKLFYLQSKLDVIHQRVVDTKTKRNGLKGDLNESRRTY